MKRRALGTFCLIVASLMVATCNQSGTSPSVVTPMAPDTVVHSVPLPGTNETFKTWVEFTPAHNTQLVTGQTVSTRWQCDAPQGFSYYVLRGPTNGPGQPIIAAGNEYGDTDECRNGVRIESTTTAGNSVACITNGGAANGNLGCGIAFYRFSIWVTAGKGNYSSAPAPNRPADFVVDEPVGWRQPQ